MWLQGRWLINKAADFLPALPSKKKATSEEMASILDCYVTRWQRWAAAGLQGIKLDEIYDAVQIQVQQYLLPTV